MSLRMTRPADSPERPADPSAGLGARLEALSGRSVALWGADPASIGQLALAPLEGLVTRIADRDPDRWGRRVHGLTVESPKALRERLPGAIVVLGEARGPELEELERRGVELVRLPTPDQSTFSKQYSASVART